MRPAAMAEDGLAQIVKRLALVFALSVGIGLPSGYFGLQYSNHIEHVEITVRLKAEGLTALVAANPELWVYQLQRVEELLLRYPPKLGDDRAIIRDAAGNPLVTVGVPPHAPVLVRSSPIYDSGRVVGQVEILHSYREVLSGTLVAGLLGLLLGVLVYATVLVLPLRALRRMSIALDAERAALRAREERFRILFDRASDGIMIVSSIGKLVAANESFARMHGYSVEEMLNMRLKDLDAPETFLLAPERLHSAYSGESMFFEVEHYHKDGHVFPLEVSASLIVSDGETLIQAFHRDITARKRQEETLKRSEERLHEAQKLAQIGNWEWNIQTGDLHWEKENYRIFGLSPETIPSVETFLGTVHPDDLEFVKQSMKDALEKQLPYDLDMRIRRPDGTERVVHAYGGIDRDAGGKAIRFFGTIQDITERKRADDDLRSTEEQFRSLVEQSIAGIYIIQDGKLAYVNPQFAEIFGYGSANEPIGRDALSVIAENERAAVAENVREWLKGGARSISYSTTALRKDGSTIEVGVHGSRADYHRRPAIIGMIEDISEKKRAKEHILRLNAELEQRVLERTRQLEATNKELEAFSYSVSHDLRAPLRGIDGFSQLLLKKYADHLDATGSDYLLRIRRASLRMGELIDDLLLLARVSRSQIKLEPLDFSRLARSILAVLQEREPERMVVTEVQDGIELSADSHLLKIVLENLLGNAWKFTAEQQPATIRIGTQVQDGELVVFVKDNGAGFDMKFAHKLFGAFQRLHGATEFEGTGIGLATVQRILNRHGGRIWADATVGKGATFYFTLPRCVPDAITTPQKGEAA